jgi:hypothetical protein
MLKNYLSVIPFSSGGDKYADNKFLEVVSGKDSA